MTLRKTWITKNIEVSEEQIKACSSDIVLAKLLANRGINTPDKIKSFLNPLKQKLISPDVFTDIDKILKRIKSAIENKENITVYGDFDADGITSASTLVLTLKKIGANVDFYLPNRIEESHGLNTKSLVNIISKKKSKLIITVDCGISNVQEVKFAKGLQADIIITDHHEAPEILPDAYAIMNPKAQNSLNSNLSMEDLQSLNSFAGAGVAFKLCCKLLEEYNCEDYVNEILPLVAIGTIGDVVELIGENRTLVTMGLELIKSGKHKGVQKLLQAANISDTQIITSETIAFGIVPRLNAAGRLESPDCAVNVLISDNNEVVEQSINILNELNERRQQLCEETFLQAQTIYEKNKHQNKKSIIILNEKWHVGIIGIVSSKLIETYNKPVLLMTKDSKCPNIIRCSARSIEQINIHSVLSEHKEWFEGFGGHKMAAGFSFDENKISFDKIKNLINQTIDEQSQDIDFSKTNIYADMEIEPENITIETINNINLLEPFGQGNSKPLFVTNNLKINQIKMMGQKNNHLKIFGEKNNKIIECLKWNTPNFSAPLGSEFNILYSLQINEFNGNKTIQYIIEDIQCEAAAKEETYSVKILDHRKKKDILNQVLEFINTTKKKTGIYAETSTLKKLIMNNEKAMKLCFDKDSIPENIEQLMFFESPINIFDFQNIINKSGAELIHLMNFTNITNSTDSIISTMSGMLKYALSNKNGVFNIRDIAKALSIDEETAIFILNLFDETQMIDLNQTSDTEYKFTFLHPVELSKLKQSELYESIEEKVNEINEFKNLYMNSETEAIKALIE